MLELLWSLDLEAWSFNPRYPLEQEKTSGNDYQRHPSIKHLPASPKPFIPVSNGPGQNPIRLAPENPARMQADRKVKIPCALISQPEQHTRDCQCEEARYERAEL